MRNVIQYSRYTLGLEKNGKETIVKVPGKGEEGYGDVISEYESYQKLRPYLKMPNCKLIEYQGKHHLVLQKIEGIEVSKSIVLQPIKAIETLNFFLDDVFKMWGATQTTYKDGSIVRNPRNNSIDSLIFFKKESFSQYFLGKQLYINNKNYGRLENIIDQVIKELSSSNDHIMVL